MALEIETDNEPHYEKLNHQLACVKTKTQLSFAVTGKLISTFVFSTCIVQFLYFLNLKFSVSSHLFVEPVRKPHCFSHIVAHTLNHFCSVFHCNDEMKGMDNKFSMSIDHSSNPRMKSVC